MEDAVAAPRRKLMYLAAILAPLAIAVALAIGMAQHAMASDPVRNGVDAQSTILSRSGDHAVVRFSTATGVLTTTTVAICHHQSYAVGNPLLVRYDPKAPEHAAERDMLPQPKLVGPALVMLFGLVVTLGLARAIGSQAFRKTTPATVEPWDGLPETPASAVTEPLPDSDDLALLEL